MRILLSNDDGINAPGINALYQELSDIAEVLVVAPDAERSASSHALTINKPLLLQKKALGYQLSGTPADCVKFGLEQLAKIKPDLVVSGVNNGPNLATDVLYSGTVAAAMEGLINDIPSLAVSLVGHSGTNFGTAAKFTKQIILDWQKNNFLPKTLLNVNVPDLAYENINGVKLTRLAYRNYLEMFHIKKTEDGTDAYWLTGRPVDVVHAKDTDIEAIGQNFVTVTPLDFDITNVGLLDKLKFDSFHNQV